MKRYWMMFIALWPYYAIFIVLWGATWALNSSRAPTPTQDISKPPNQVRTESVLTVKGKKVKSKHPSWDNDDCNTIGDRKVHAGMTTEQAIAAWGKPYKINETNYGNHIHEQWVMHEMGASYLYFEDGLLTTIQTSR